MRNLLAKAHFLIPLLFGISAFLLIVGPQFLNPQNLSNIQSSDVNQHYLAWDFFRYDAWHFPIGMNPKYGLVSNSSIIYSDSIPLLAFLFKPLSFLLPSSFQYLGLWTLGCFVIQSMLAWLLAGLITPTLRLRALAMALMVLAPPMLFRIGVHAALVSQFIVLSALYLNFSKPRQSAFFYWLCLLGLSVLVHFYLFCMAAILWLAYLFDQTFRQNKLTLIQFLWQLGVTVPFIGLIFWVSGYFVSPLEAIASSGFGLYPMNMLALFDADGWSYILPKIPRGNSSDEGFMYLGLGFIFLLPFVFIKLKKEWFAYRKGLTDHVFLLIAFALLILLALSNQIYFGKLHIELPIFDFIYQLGSIVRASGRMFWPIFYALLFGIIFIIIKAYSLPRALLLLGMAFLLQLVDTSAGWLPKRVDFAQVRPFQVHPNLDNPFWASAAKCYSKVITVLPQNSFDDHWNWVSIARYAATHRLPTNSAYLTRIAPAINRPIENNKYEQFINQGIFDQSALYILDPQKILPVLQHLKPATDLLASINSLVVYAPNYQACATKVAIPPEMQIMGPVIDPKIDQVFSFARDTAFAKTPYLLAGWSHPELWGTWSNAKVALITLPLPTAGNPKQLNLTMRAFLPQGYPIQDVEIWVNGFKEQTLALSQETTTVSIALTSQVLKDGYLMLGFRLNNPISPKKIGLGDDDRELGIGLISGKFK